MILDFLKVLILSFVEGLTEFIPVSSTGHLIIVDNFLTLSNDKNFVTSFQIIIQLGAILAVVVYYRKEIFPVNIKLWLKLCFAIIPFGLIGVFFEDIIVSYLFSARTVAIALIFYGLLLIFIEKTKKYEKKGIDNIENINIWTYLKIGLFQCLAIIPGTSRSASTIIGAMLLGLNRNISTKVSFFLAIPTMFGASGYRILKMKSMTSYQAFLIFLGFVLSYIFAYYFISKFIKYIKNNDFRIFGIYRIVLGSLVLLILGGGR